jgi:sensor domain CHASE-containing protein
MRHSPISLLLGNEPVPPSLIVWVASFISHSISMLRLRQNQLRLIRQGVREQARRIRTKPKKIRTPSFRITQHLNRISKADPHMYPGRWRKAARATCIAFQDANRHYAKALRDLLDEYNKLFRTGPSRKNLNRKTIIPILPKGLKHTNKG